MRKFPPTLRPPRQRLARLCGALLLTLLMGLGSATQAAEKRNGLGGMNAPPPRPVVIRAEKGQVRMLVDGERVMTVVVDHQGRIKNKR